MPDQLQMLRDDLENLPPLSLPDGYALRTWLPGDEQAWADIMNTGIGSDWTAGSVREKLCDRPQFIPDAVFFVTCAGQPVGSATAWRWPEDDYQRGYVHMVCVAPEHRGRNLGYLVTLATLHWFKAHGRSSARLETDDWRLAAVRSYLRLGFHPAYDAANAEMAGRWTSVMAALK